MTDNNLNTSDNLSMNGDLSMPQYISLAAIMLLAPVIPLAIENNEIVLSPQEVDFVQSYIVYGNYVLVILLVSGLLRGIETFLRKNSILNYISQWGSMFAIAMIFLGMYAIMRKAIIMQGKKINHQAVLALFKRTK